MNETQKSHVQFNAYKNTNNIQRIRFQETFTDWSWWHTWQANTYWMAEYAILCRWLHRLHLGLSEHMVPRNPWLSFPRGWICCLIIMFAINVCIYIYILYYIILHYIILYYIISYYIILYHIILYYIVSYYIILFYFILYYIIYTVHIYTATLLAHHLQFHQVVWHHCPAGLGWSFVHASQAWEHGTRCVDWFQGKSTNIHMFLPIIQDVQVIGSAERKICRKSIQVLEAALASSKRICSSDSVHLWLPHRILARKHFGIHNLDNPHKLNNRL